METAAVKKLIEDGLPGCQAFVTGDGRHFEADVVSDEFADKTPLAKQRMVLATCKEQIASDELHAISIRTHTPEQWAERGQPSALGVQSPQ